MKKKDFFYSAFLALSMAFTMGACSNEDDPTPTPDGETDP